MKKAKKIAQGNKRSNKAKEKPNRMFETKSKGTSQKALPFIIAYIAAKNGLIYTMFGTFGKALMNWILFCGIL